MLFVLRTKFKLRRTALEKSKIKKGVIYDFRNAENIY